MRCRHPPESQRTTRDTTSGCHCPLRLFEAQNRPSGLAVTLALLRVANDNSWYFDLSPDDSVSQQLGLFRSSISGKQNYRGR